MARKPVARRCLVTRLHTARLFLLLLLASQAPCSTHAAPADAGSAPAGRYVIGLTPFLDTSAKDDVLRQIVQLVVEDLPLGSSLWLYDAYHLRSIAHLDIPALRAFASSRTRVNQFKSQIQELRRFLAQPPAPPVAPTNAGYTFENAVRLPQFLDFVAANLLTPPDNPPVVLLLGSPLYRDDKEPGFAMVDGYFPSDGHLLAGRDASVFGLRERRDALGGVTIYWAFTGDPWVSDVHREKVGRFWNLFLAGQGARLATFTGDLPTAFHALRNTTPVEASNPARYSADPGQTRVEMLRITREVGVADWITRDLPAGPRPTAPTASRGPLKIGIRWRGNLDLDLYARARPDHATLSFEHPRNPDGYYHKDHRSSPEHEYEFIEFTAPVDLQQVEASVDFYQGAAPGGANGEVRVEFAGRVYAGEFHIPAGSGNQGRGGAGQEAFWAPLDIPRLLGLRESSR